MKKFTIPLILSLSLGLFLITLMATAPSQASPNQPAGLPPAGLDIYTNRQMESGVLSTHNQSILGPKICTSYGDPFSPWNSRYTPGSYSYQYRIMIPPDYPHNVVRVELFDPDSINQAANSQAMWYTQAALNTGEVSGSPSGSCANSSQINVCLIPTGEVASNGNAVGGLDLQQVNPFWFMRVDENRGAGSGDGNGTCDVPGTYTPRYNTETLYQLYYYRDNGDETTQRVDLSSYVGQTGDGVRDNGNHNTDMQWISPGAGQQSYDYQSFFPGSTVDVEPGSATSFEIDLTTEVPNMITDETTGARYIYMDITTLSGASENGFEIWAGPPNYVDTVPGEVNARNIYILDNPGSHGSQGVKVFAMGYLPHNAMASFRVDIPLTDISAAQAGETIYISTFDMDAGTAPPLTFYMDTIAEEDWSLSFGLGGTDPDGITSTLRCIAGSIYACNDQWIDPPYEIKLPAGTKDCDFSNPTPEACTPFYGGRLYVRSQYGAGDSYVWSIPGLGGINQNPIGYEGCDAFPIAIHEGLRSVTQAQYPTSGYPQSPPIPSYGSFIHHKPNVPLLLAGEGDVFLIQNGFGSGNFGWLSWNQGISNSSNTLADSLAWPGNNNDYTNHGDAGQSVSGSGFAHVVRGYIEPGDPVDQQLHTGDWIFSSTGAISSAEIRSVLNEHITLGRTLRLPIWNVSQASGNSGMYQASGFAIFRIHGYNVTGGNDSWLLLEFIRLDYSCGQTPMPLTDVEIEGATRSFPNEDVSFTAHSRPLYATQPITYTWEATDFAPITHSGGISDTVTFNWATTGTKTITVTAENTHNTVTDVHTILVSDLVEGKDLTIIGTPQLVTPLPLIAGDPVTFAITIKNLGDTAVSGWYYLSIFANPTTIEADGIPIAEADASEYIFGLDPGESRTIQIAVNDGLALPGAGTPHQIYAMVDSDKDVLEVNETNNVSSPASLSIDDFVKPPTAVSIDGSTITYLNETLTFTADILPLNATQPVSYTWEATDFAPVTHSGGISDTITFNWAMAGTKTITVTAVNAGGSTTDTHTVTVNDLVQGKDLTIIGTPQLITPLPIDEGQPLTFAVTVRNNGTEDITSHWFVDLFVNPATIEPDGIPVSESKGFTTLSALNAGESKTVNITLDDGLPMPNTPHQIYAMVDTFKNITEANENNNISEALPFGANNFIEWQFIYLPVILKP